LLQRRATGHGITVTGHIARPGHAPVTELVCAAPAGATTPIAAATACATGRACAILRLLALRLPLSAPPLTLLASLTARHGNQLRRNWPCKESGQTTSCASLTEHASKPVKMLCVHLVTSSIR